VQCIDHVAPALARAPLRVAVCYTGSVGTQAIRLIATRRDQVLVGVLVKDPAKAGLDAGTLVDGAPVGVRTTTSMLDVIAAAPDCVLWLGRGWQPDEVCTLLRAGVNVYVPVGAWYLPDDPDFDQVETACQAGCATLVGGGSIPGLVTDVLPLFLSGYVGAVRAVRAWQSNLIGDYPSPEQLRIGLGFGGPIPRDWPDARDARWIRHISQSARMISSALDVEWGDVRITDKQFLAAPHELRLPNGLVIPAGATAGVRWVFTANDPTGATCYTVTKEQVAAIGLGPGWRDCAVTPQWRVEIDGTPSLACTLSPVTHTGFGTTTAELNAARAVNLVPSIVAAAPGCRSTLDFAAPVGRYGGTSSN
jgi:2,4-diaminopentanoate dehydrogenase